MTSLPPDRPTARARWRFALALFAISLGLQAVLIGPAKRTEIGTCAEGSVVAKEHRDACFAVGFERAKRSSKSLSRGAVDGVLPLLPIEDDGSDKALSLGAQHHLSVVGFTAPREGVRPSAQGEDQ